jgi:hypothetical protein
LDGDHDGVPEAAGAAVSVAIARDPVTRRLELRGLVGVDVQQRPRQAPLKPLEGLTLPAAPPRDAVTLEDLPNRRDDAP